MAQFQADALGLLLQHLGRGGLDLTPPAYPWAPDERENFRPSYRGDEPAPAPPVDLREVYPLALDPKRPPGARREVHRPDGGSAGNGGGEPGYLQEALAQRLGGAPDLSGGYSMGRKLGQTTEPLNLNAGFNLPGLGLSIGSSLRPGRGLTAPEFRAYHRIPF